MNDSNFDPVRVRENAILVTIDRTYPERFAGQELYDPAVFTTRRLRRLKA